MVEIDSSLRRDPFFAQCALLPSNNDNTAELEFIDSPSSSVSRLVAANIDEWKELSHPQALLSLQLRVDPDLVSDSQATAIWAQLAELRPPQQPRFFWRVATSDPTISSKNNFQLRIQSAADLGPVYESLCAELEKWLRAEETLSEIEGVDSVLTSTSSFKRLNLTCDYLLVPESGHFLDSRGASMDCKLPFCIELSRLPIAVFDNLNGIYPLQRARDCLGEALFQNI